MSERFEKNPLYVNDPFMRHWASPEGQWITFKDGRRGSKAISPDQSRSACP